VTPGYALLDLAAGFRPDERLEVRVLLGNVLDRSYPSSSDVQAPLAAGITASLAVSGRF
jgi:outer membrane receptor protein involved in Fe transport